MKLVFNGMRQGAWENVQSSWIDVALVILHLLRTQMISGPSLCTAGQCSGAWWCMISLLKQQRSILLGKMLSADLEGCSHIGADQWSGSFFKEIGAVDEVAGFSFAISEHYEWQETAMLYFSLEMSHVCMEDVFKRLIFMLVWAKAVQSYSHNSGCLHFSRSWFRKQPKLEVNFWTALMSRTRSWNWHGAAHLRKIWWLNLICAVSVELSELQVKDGVVPVKVHVLCLYSSYTDFYDQLHGLGNCTQENKVLPFKCYSATALIAGFILVHRSCRQKLPQMKFVCLSNVFWIKDNMRFHTLCLNQYFSFVFLKFY